MTCLGMLSVALGSFAQTSGNAGSLNLTLDKAIEIALAENPTIKVAEKEIELKNVAKTEAWMDLLPTLDGTMSLSHSIKVAEIKIGDQKHKFGNDGSTTATGALTLQLPIFAPTVYQNMKLSKQDIELAVEKARGSKLDLVNQVKKAFYGALLSQDSYKTVKKNYDLTKLNFDMVNARFNVGSVSEYDKITAEVQLRNINSALKSAETGMTLSLLQLKVVMGVTADVDIAINDSLKAYEDKLTLRDGEFDESELNNNSSLKQMDFNMQLLSRSRKMIHSSYLPTIGAQLSGQYQSISNPDWNIFGYQYSPSSTFAISVTVPLFHANTITKLKSNNIQMQQLAETKVDTQRKLSLAAESYRKNMACTIAQVESNKEAVKQANKALTISSKMYEVGSGTILDLNSSETALVQSELTYNQSIYDYLTNKADLEYTLGREK